jgi:hypothetical protein
VLSKLGPSTLCLADRLFVGYELWRQAEATHAALLSIRTSCRFCIPSESCADTCHGWQLFPLRRWRRFMTRS